MRWRRFIGPAWVVIAVIAVLCWWQVHARRGRSQNQNGIAAANFKNPAKTEKTARTAADIAKAKPQESFHFLSQATHEAPDPVSTKPNDRFKYRLTNTPKPIGDLVHNEKAILL